VALFSFLFEAFRSAEDGSRAFPLFVILNEAKNPRVHDSD
jgi:hypothetical protein